MRKKLIIGVDLDDVVVDFYSAFCLYHNQKYGTVFTRDDISSWHLEEVLGCTQPEAVNRVREFQLHPVFEEVGCIPGSTEVIAELAHNYCVCAVTSRSEASRAQTLCWLEKYCPALTSRVHFTNHFEASGRRSKGEVCRDLGVQVFIEDAPVHVESVAQFIPQVYLLDAPWNREYVDLPSNVKRVFSWHEILELLKPLGNL